MMLDDDKLRSLEGRLESWERENAAELQKERQTEFVCESGIPIKRLYTPLDLEQKGFDYETALGFPGEYPCTRGTSPTMYRGQLWQMWQPSSYATPEECNALWKRLTAKGLNSILVLTDLPTQLGFDPDHPMAEGEVGRIGVSMASLRDYEVAFDGIDISKLTVSPLASGQGALGMAMHFLLAEKKGARIQDLQGYVQNDVLCEYIARGNYIFPPRAGVRLVVDALDYCSKNAPHYRGISVAMSQFSEKGATPVREAAFGIANAIAYMEAALARGLDVDSIAPHMGFTVSHEHFGFFQEIAKHRATRRIWARTLKERFGARNKASFQFKTMSPQGGTSLYREQYLNNIVRSSISTLGAVLGGLQRCQPKTFQEPFGIPSPEAIETALRTQLIVAHETGVTDTIDPLAGSYYVESLTSEMEDRIVKEIDNVDKLGGSIKAIEQGYIQQRIIEDAYAFQKDMESGKILRVGFNCFRSEETGPGQVSVTPYRADPAVREKRIADLAELRRNRDNSRVKVALADLQTVAREEADGSSNLLPPILDACREYATMGEICSAFREVWGTYEPMGF